jgi:hypothetical protein
VLALVSEESGNFDRRVTRRVLDMIGNVWLPKKQMVRAVCIPGFRKERVIACSDQTVGYEPTGVPVIRMQAVTAPRIVPQEHVGLYLADHLAYGPAISDSRVELTVNVVQEGDVASTKQPRSLDLLEFPDLLQLVYVGRLVPGAFRTVGEHQMMDKAPCGRPLRKRGAAAELDVVWMSADRERHGGDR